VINLSKNLICIDNIFIPTFQKAKLKHKSFIYIGGKLLFFVLEKTLEDNLIKKKLSHINSKKEKQMSTFTKQINPATVNKEKQSNNNPQPQHENNLNSSLNKKRMKPKKEEPILGNLDIKPPVIKIKTEKNILDNLIEGVNTNNHKQNIHQHNKIRHHQTINTKDK
jgi:hypothetical protein